MKRKKQNLILITCIVIVAMLTSCGYEYGEIVGQNAEQQITGLTYTMDGFDNYGHKTLTVHGEQIYITPEIVEELVYVEPEWKTVKTESSVVTVTVDRRELESCGDTLIFYEDDLIPDYNFYTQTGLKTNDDLSHATEDVEKSETPVMESEADSSLSSNSPAVEYMVNNYKKYFSKKRVVLIKSQMGTPIYAFSGNDVYWKISKNIPKCTKLSVDGKALYIHRANFQIIDTALLSNINEYGMNRDTNAEKVEQQKESGAEDAGTDADENTDISGTDNESNEANAIIEKAFANITVEGF